MGLERISTTPFFNMAAEFYYCERLALLTQSRLLDLDSNPTISSERNLIYIIVFSERNRLLWLALHRPSTEQSILIKTQLCLVVSMD